MKSHNSPTPKIALVFDDLVQFGGAERLLLAFFEIWPDAELFTSVISHRWRKRLKGLGIKYHLSFMQSLPFCCRLNKFYSILGLHCIAFENFHLNDFDLVISISARYAHGVITKPQTLHISYCNSPGRMFWEPEYYFKNKSWLRKILGLSLSYLRLWDRSVSARADVVIANSRTVRDRLQKYNGIYADKVIYPFVDFTEIRRIISKNEESVVAGKPYFLVVSRLVSWKRVDTVVEAFNSLGINLVVVGEGPDFSRLKSLACQNVTFLGYVPEDRKIILMKNAEAVIIPQIEDFGIVPLESMACGTPVIAYNSGGSTETVVPGISGILYKEQSADAIKEVINRYSKNKFNPDLCIVRAENFSKEIFSRIVKDYVDSVYSNGHVFSN